MPSMMIRKIFAHVRHVYEELNKQLQLQNNLSLNDLGTFFYISVQPKGRFHHYENPA